MKMLVGMFLGVFLLSSVACQALDSGQSFGAFWIGFREASLKKDYTTLKTLIKLPLEVKGVDDETPANFYSENKISQIFPLLLEQTIYHYEEDDLQEQSFKELIEQREAITVAADEMHHRVEQFEFQKIKGQWLLVRAYLE